ncbi:MAG TPA: pyruvate dehydrogenase complex E1 component subunit beta, partial [Capsulimonadaceae bacterium]|nr:pyruvate dehydrogenase complex E1 component subunit beta [Capsulimonadaceae bacterium]
TIGEAGGKVAQTGNGQKAQVDAVDIEHKSNGFKSEDIPTPPDSDLQKNADAGRTKTVVEPSPQHKPDLGKTVTASYRDAIKMALAEELDRDEKVFMLGEEIGQYQGTFKITEGFLQKYGADRIVDTPISEAGMVGMATGAAMLGLRPVLEFMTLNFSLVAWDQIINHTAKILYMSGGQYPVPLVMRGPGGVGSQLSAQHSQDLSHWFANTPGLYVVAPATPADAKGLLKAAIRNDNPVIYVEHAKLYSLRGDVPESADYTVPIGKADIKREGRDITLVSYSRGTILSLAAAEELAKQEIEAEVVDLRSLMPIDYETVLASVRKTHRAVIVQEQWPYYGIAAEFAAEISDKAFDDLDAPVARVTGAFVPMPYAKALEDIATPHEGDIIAAVKKTLERSV